MGEIRVISGLWGGRWIKAGRPKPGKSPRPTSGRARTSLFDRLSARIPGAQVLDLFSGTGALGIEALSRGADHVTFVEQSSAVLKLLEANLASLGAHDFKVRQEDAFRALTHLWREGRAFDLILADPPYASRLAARVVAELDEVPVLKPGGWLVVEHDRRERMPETGRRIRMEDEREYGDTVLSFYRGA